jgi:phosphatidylserine/phosphatidylglycerophosphate/cardiolipin synthase-like enzyme
MKNILILLFVASTLLVNAQTIYQIQGQTANSPYDNSEVTTKGIVTATYSTGYFIQDGDTAWTGIYIYDQGNTPAIGDSVTLTGTVDEYYGMTEIVNLSGFATINTGNTLPAPIVVTSGEATEAYESVLIRVEEAECTNPDLGYGEWEINDGSGPVAVDDMGIAFAPTVGVSYTVTGPLNYSYSAFKIEPRDENDIEVAEAVFFTNPLSITDIQETSVTLTWETNVAANTNVAIGTSNALEIDTITSDSETTSHTITLEGLSANSFYYIKPFSATGGDTTISHTSMIATKSTSTGEMKVYFNHSIDSTVMWQNYANSIPNEFTDTIISYINMAQTTLDITMYDIVDTTDNEVIRIMHAINDAYDRGVDIRYITDDTPENPLLDSLNPAINILPGNSEAIMHDKFMVIDRDDIQNSWVLTGSTNHTIANLNKDYNNIICIQDYQLAQAYTLEFNEMWGSETLIPDAGNALFGADKTDNTPHFFNIGSVDVQCYFSPSDKTTSKIIEVIDGAQESVEFAVLVFTENTLGTAILDAHNRGIDVRGIVDYTDYSGDEYSYLLENGVNVLEYENEDGSQWPIGATLHHKYAVIDQNTDNAVLVTGSHNWSASAESRNDENTLIIHDRNMANLYYQEFSKRFSELLALNSTNEIDYNNTLKVYPNPAKNNINIVSDNNGIYRIYNIQGQTVNTGKLNTGINQINVDLVNGMYIVEIQSGSEASKTKLIIK